MLEHWLWLAHRPGINEHVKVLLLQYFKSPEAVYLAQPEELLLTSSVSCPAILAECGFMSNPQEAGRLANDDYQMKIAMTLVASYIQFSCQQL